MKKRLCEICESCPKKMECDKKRMECIGEIELLDQIQAPMVEPISEKLCASVCVPHDFRDIKIAEGTTITIDLEEAKERMKKELEIKLHCNLLPGT